jgi:ABC-type multidrug transport system ATPase subunit
MPLLMGLCDRVYAMEQGVVIAEGSPDQVRDDPRGVASYLGTDEVAIGRSGSSVGTTSLPAAGPVTRPRRPVTGKVATAKAQRATTTRPGSHAAADNLKASV